MTHVFWDHAKNPTIRGLFDVEEQVRSLELKQKKTRGWQLLSNVFDMCWYFFLEPSAFLGISDVKPLSDIWSWDLYNSCFVTNQFCTGLLPLEIYCQQTTLVTVAQNAHT